jgi:hypothetical protein
MQQIGKFFGGITAILALLGVIVGVGSATSVPMAAAEVTTKTVQIDQYTLITPTGTVSPADVLTLSVSGGVPGQTVTLRGAGLDMVDPSGRLVTSSSGLPGSAVFNAAGDAQILFATHVGAVVGLDGSAPSLLLTGEVQLPGRDFAPALQIDSIEPTRVSAPRSVTAGDPWLISVSAGRPNSDVDLSIDSRLYRSIRLDANGNGQLSTTFFSPRDLAVNLVMVSVGGRDIRGLNSTLSIVPPRSPITRSAPSPSYETFALRQYRITLPTGVVYEGEPLEAILEGGTPGTKPDLQGAYIANSTFPAPLFDGNGQVRIPFDLRELGLSPQQVVPILISLPEVQLGYFPIGEVVGERKNLPASTTLPAPTTLPTPTTLPAPTTLPTTLAPTTTATTAAPTTQPATTQPATTQPATTQPPTTVPVPIRTFAVSAPDRVAVGERFTASVGGLLPGAIVAFSAGSNELGWAVADSTGTATVNNAIWRRGTYSLTVNEIVDGVTVVRSASRPIQVGAIVATTIPHNETFAITAPPTVAIGQPIDVKATGVDVDSIIEVEAGDVTLGWASVDSSGTATVSNALWQSGTYTVTVTEWRYGQKLSTQTVSVSVQ